MHPTPPLLYLNADAVRQALPMPEAIAAMKTAFVQLSTGQATMPARTHLDIPEQNATVLLMPCHCAAEGFASVKFITLFSHNHARGLPLIQALVLLADATNGLPLAIMDGATLTAIRTGAASGVATEVLARPDADVAAIFGAGVQARTQLEAVCAVRPLRHACVYDPDATAAEQFAADMSQRLGLPVERVPSPTRALADATIVCTATTSRVAVFEDKDLQPGTHVNAIGSYKPDVTEIPAATVRRARIVVDHCNAAIEEAGDLLLPLGQGLIQADQIRTELGDLLTGRAAGRQWAKEITLFKSVGLAIQDLCAAVRALANARRLNLGTTLPR